MLGQLLRTHNCGELRLDHVGKEVTLCGWVQKKRFLGGLTFLDLRDKYGITQLGFETSPQSAEASKQATLESVVRVTGTVTKRPSSAVNKDRQTGEIEVAVSSFTILSLAERTPFLPESQQSATEDLRLKYRYLEMRSSSFQRVLALRSETLQKTRALLSEKRFIEVETPILYKTTPEGARDFIVPSRNHKKKVYALPQSPQTLKQLLMIGSTDRYFQICRCFRDEDFRADRQPEFSQLDLEVSFATKETMKSLAKELIRCWFSVGKDFELESIDYDEAMRSYGTDRPDLRFGLRQHDVTSYFKSSQMKLFADIASSAGLIKAQFLPKESGELTRKQLDGLAEVVKPVGGKGVGWCRQESEEMKGPLAKFMSPELGEHLASLAENKPGVWLFNASQNHEEAHACADVTRRHLAEVFSLYEKDFAFCWVENFPLVAYDEELERFFAVHHPFTAPTADCVESFFGGDKEAWKGMKADAYDLVCNGLELGGGSLRIFDPKMQSQMFHILGMDEQTVQQQFGFFVEALQYGTPPHAGMAFGLDRLVMLQAGLDSIREVIAFPKTSSGMDLMASTPSYPSEDQLNELGVSWRH